MSLTDKGYIVRSAEELQNSLLAKIKEKVPEFLLQPADVQSNIINSSMPSILEFENVMAEIFNSLSASGSNVYLFKQLGESLNMRQLSSYKAQVILEFSGKYGTFIPKGTKAKNEAGDIFITQSAVVIPTTQKVQVLALGDTENIAEAGSVDSIVTQLSDDVSVTNPSASLAYISEETDTQYIQRVQKRFRSTKKGGIDYAMSIFESIPSIDKRLIKFKTATIEADGYKTMGIEAIVGGGSNEEIALALYLSFLETKKLVSNPSDGDSSRTIVLDLDVNNNIIPITFTRPKMLNIEITLKITFEGTITTPTALEGLLSKDITNYINNMSVGTPFNFLSLNNLIMPLLVSAGIPIYNVKTMGYDIKLDNEVVEFDPSTGFLNEIKSDCYLQLTSFIVDINA